MRFLFLMILSIAGLAFTPSAHELTVRNGHSMAVDPASGNVFLFGGADESKVYGDLWKLTEDGWEFVTDKGPAPRTFAGLAFDEGRGSLILFGGNDSLFGTEERRPRALSDTWEFRNENWRKLDEGEGPPPRAEAAMAYDRAARRLVLFGGYSMGGTGLTKFGDTWEFNLGRWRQILHDGPSPRNGATAAYDPIRKEIVLFGGSPTERSYGPGTGETWLLKGDRWRKIGIAQPANVFDSEMVFDPITGAILRFGGWNGETRIGELWKFPENGWTRIDSRRGPSPRNHTAMVYDPVNRRVVLFGGHDGNKVFGDLWFYKSGKWTLAADRKPLERVENGH